MTWYQSVGHKGPVLRHRGIGTERARTQLRFCSNPHTIWGITVIPCLMWLMVFRCMLISGAVRNLEATNIVGKFCTYLMHMMLWSWLIALHRWDNPSLRVYSIPSSEGMSEVLLQCFMPWTVRFVLILWASGLYHCIGSASTLEEHYPHLYG